VQQLALELRWQPAHALEHFVFADSATREQVMAAIRAGAMPTLFVGAAGCGKSTLLQALAGHCGWPLHTRGALAHSNTSEAAQALTQAQLIDDLEHASEAAQLALFHSYNRAHDLRLPWLASVSQPPERLTLLPDLRSRLQQCVQIQLPQLDSEQRRQVLRQQAQDYGFSLRDEVLDLLDIYVSRDLAALSDALRRLHHASLGRAKKPSAYEVRKWLSEHHRQEASKD
jgi:DnaA-homolog protein